MKKTVFIGVLLILPLLWVGCAKETIDPETFGSISGRVINSVTGKGVANASVTTVPGTEALLTGPDGKFLISGIPTGQYTVKVIKEYFKTSSVRISVTEDSTATAQILMDPGKGSKPSSEILEASVTSFTNVTTPDKDSTFVEVEYAVRNKSNNIAASHYEIYFKISTSGDTFYQEVQGDSLNVGEQSFGSFKKYIRTFKASNVVVSGVFSE